MTQSGSRVEKKGGDNDLWQLPRKTHSNHKDANTYWVVHPNIREPKAMAQYGISKIRDRQILIAASEFGWIHEHGAKDDMWAEIEPCSELDRTSQLVYGGFLLNPSQVTGSLDPKSLSVMQGMEMAYVHFEPQRNRFYSWRSLRVIDLEILDDQRDHFTFAAIVDVAKEATRTRSFSISAFPYNMGLSVQQNITTRVGVLAINDADRRNQRKLNDSNWRLLVDRPRARRSAARVRGQEFCGGA